LKFEPEVFTQWLQVLQGVKGSVLCLLENPAESKEHILSFVSHYDATLKNRVLFLPFVANPYDNQNRISKQCSVVLDCRLYNGHTTTTDALWAGI
jgi:predicted O-linked N-acetylglucosamine transferase (SPINDLY family)